MAVRETMNPPFGDSNVQLLQAPDHKETMEIGEDQNLVSPWPNMWPAEGELNHFRPFMISFFEACHGLHLEIMRALGLAMGLGENYFDNKVSLVLQSSEDGGGC